MNYYDKEMERIRRNFNFSMQIYSGNVLLQRTLCVQMMEKLSNFFIPNQLLSAKIMRHQLYQAIQNIYVQLSAIEVYRQKGI